jgi:hypothetical protein
VRALHPEPNRRRRARVPGDASERSLSQGTILVSRFAGRYRIWAQLH